jgi:molybdenum cofactor cytidylyltransferase
MLIGIVLAAGASSRMGRVKALLPADEAGNTFLSRVVRTFREAHVDDVIVVTGHHREAVEQEIERRPIPARVIYNPRHEQGQLTSLQAAIGAVDRSGVDAVVVTLVDVPLVTAATMGRVIAAYQRTHANVVRPVDRTGRHGHPVLFDRGLFGALLSADPRRGAKPIVREQIASGAGIEVPVDDPGAFDDIDTPEAYARTIGPWPF